MIFLSFYTTTHSMKGEAQAKKQGLAASLVPTPRGVGGSCSLSLCFEGTEAEREAQAFFEEMTVPCALYRQEGEELTCLGRKEAGA
ncbi:DUF3343 domain-containing protein [Pseudoflavonifractor sp. MCC625]|uniref:DUF3343 domain-containing protein n=1 Tax=Pseudoflavonifractor sp. MCC625 TaxID=2592647 RepID=UPI001C01C75C|nr:DUF3343 domain-containing protein [Pseudoflavonifractor sp. MCC625]MBT9685511.1 DUF3343 domain-containing protein [Pseudoflavonifractor sp. MCC625]